MRVFRRSAVLVVLALGWIALPLSDRSCLAGDAPGKEEAGVIRTAALMLEPVKWDKDENTRRLDAAIREARKKGAELVVTPEGAIEGYVENEVIYATGAAREKLTKRFNETAESVDGPHVRHFLDLCKELRVHLVLGLLEADQGKMYNTAVLIGPDGKILGKYRKTHFAQGHGNGEKKGDNPPNYFPGTDYPVFDFGKAKLGIMICYDRRVPEVARRLVENGATFVVNPSFGVQGNANRRYLSARAKENHVPVLFVHPHQALFVSAEAKIVADVRPKDGDERICVVSIRPAQRKAEKKAGD